MRIRPVAGDVLWAWLIATLFSGLPSTLYFTATGQSLWPPIHAVGAMLLPPQSLPAPIFVAAALVHSAVSLFWTIVVAVAAPVKRVILYALGASALIAVLDLRLIAPWLFPEVAALSFPPQLADHLMWGLLVGVTLKSRRTQRHAVGRG
jgi:hypothetical protein